jgi:capsular polysaccharide biosynthesis protein
MDLLNIFSTLRRHKIILLAILLLTAGGCAYVVLGIPPQYQTQAQYVLVEPPAAPSDADIQADPELRKLNSNNPYLRLPNPSIVVDVLAQRVSSDTIRQALIDAGADRNYEIASTNAIGSGLVIQITGTGTSAAAASNTLQLVTDRMNVELKAMQKVNGADDRFLFQALPVSAPTPPLRKVTGTLRSLIAVAAAGAVFLFGAISIAEAVPARRKRRVRSVPPAPEGHVYRSDPGVRDSGRLTGGDGPSEVGAGWLTGSSGPHTADPGARNDSPTQAVERTNGDRETDLTIVLPRLRFDGLEGQAKHTTKD